MTVRKTATFQVRPEGLDRVRENEPGTLRYLSLQERDDPTRFTAVLYPICVQPVEFTDLALLATTESQPS